MTPQELKNSILQLAIQGKLVPQIAEEGTGEELYQQIQAEKQKLIKEGKIKKEKPLPPISEDEIPFEIPESWKWVHLNQIAESSLGKTLDKAKNTGELCPYLCSINVYWDNISLEKVKEAKFTDQDKQKYRLQRGDLLICEGGDIGRAAVWESDEEMYYQNALHRVRFYSGLSPYYFKLIIKYYKGSGIINEYSKGMTIKHLVQNSLYAMWMPLPPLAEQKRIVAKIEELFREVDRYGESWEKLQKLNEKFPEDMKKSLLQYAIQGKLVEQRPEEGTAEELYQQIQAEKQSLIKAGKIRKEKQLPEITEDEIPFEIPESWKWVRFQNITQSIGDGLHGTPVFSGCQTSFPFINGNNLEDKKIIIRSDTKFVDKVEYEKYCISLSSRALLLSINGTIGNIAYYNDETIVLGKSACYIDPLTPVMREYVELFLRTKYFLDYSSSKATKTTISNLGLTAIRNCPVPIPPLAEQKRIVAKLEELINLIKKLN